MAKIVIFLLYFTTKKEDLNCVGKKDPSIHWLFERKVTKLDTQILGESVKHLIVLDETSFSTLSLGDLKLRQEGILFVYNSLLCAALSDKGKVWLGCNRVKVINMCHRTVTFGIHSTATTKETENSVKTHGGLPLGGFCFLCHVSCSPWTLGQCQLSVSGWEEEC